MSGHSKWSEIKHKNPKFLSDKSKIEYEFKKRKRKDLINAMEITVYSLTNAELDTKLRKELEEAVERIIKQHKDSKALAYSIVKE